jgi:adenylyltransferase/sulfurtransferase
LYDSRQSGCERDYGAGAKLDQNEKLFLLDVREQDEREAANIGGEHIPLQTLADNLNRIPKDSQIVVYCRSGGRSRKACDDIQTKLGLSQVFNLKGGIMQWAEEIDSKLRPI